MASPNEPVDQGDMKSPWGWQLWLDHMKWKDKLTRAATHKALGIPDEMGDITTTTKTGMGWKELTAIGGIGLGAAHLMMNKDEPAPEPVQQPAVQSQEIDPSKFKVLFYDKDGNPISVPHISQIETE